MTDTAMKVITIRQPFAHLIATGAKRIENRTWMTAYRGPLAIHAGKTRPDADLIKELAATGFTIPADLTYGAVVAVVELVDCATLPELPPDLAADPFAVGPWCWILRDARTVGPIPWIGRIGLREFHLDESTPKPASRRSHGAPANRASEWPIVKGTKHDRTAAIDRTDFAPEASAAASPAAGNDAAPKIAAKPRPDVDPATEAHKPGGIRETLPLLPTTRIAFSKENSSMDQPIILTDLLTADQAGKLIGVGAGAIRCWAHAGILPAFKFGNRFWIAKADVLAMLDRSADAADQGRGEG